MTRSAAASSSSGVAPGVSRRRASARAAAVADARRAHRAQLGRRLVDRATEHAGEAQAAPWTGWAGTSSRDASASKMRAVTSSSVPTPSMRTTSPAPAVHVEDRRRLALVDREAIGDHLFGVVGAALVDRALAEPADALLARHDELDHGVERLAARGQEGLEVVDLGAVAGEPVEQEAARGIRLREAVAHELAGELVGDEVARLDDRLDALAELGAAGDVLAEHVAGRDRRHLEGARDQHALRPLAGALRADDQEAGGTAGGSRHRRSPS